MSLTSELPLTSKVLLLFKIDLRDQQSELTHAIDKTHKEIRALAGYEPGDVIRPTVKWMKGAKQPLWSDERL